jgi:hypothetical protein
MSHPFGAVPLDDRDHRDLSRHFPVALSRQPPGGRSPGQPQRGPRPKMVHKLAAGVLLVCCLPVPLILLVQLAGGFGP